MAEMKIENDIIDSAVEVLKRIKQSKVATIFFIKKNGEKRIMKCTLDFTLIPKEKKPKDFKFENALAMIKKNILRVFDVEKQEWRSIPVSSAQFIKTQDNKLYKVNLFKGKKGEF
jgi:hypothetical protein